MIYFATNRNIRVRQRGRQRVYEFGDRFSEDGPEDLIFGWVDAPGQSITNIVDTPQALKQAMDALRVRMRQEKRDLVFYLHGFRNQFEDALTAGHQLEALFTEAGYPALVCVLSWPANKSLITPKNYFDDRDDAALSGLAMGRAFQYLIDFLRELPQQDHCGQRCHLLTHSMGAYVLRHAVQRLRHVRPARLFEEVLLFAPDEDDDAFEFERKLQPLERLCRRITLYHNRGDVALMASDWTKANPDRLGQQGLHNTRLSPDKVVSVDCSALAGSRHDYHLTVTAVQADLVAVLQGTATEAIANRAYVPHRATFRLLR